MRRWLLLLAGLLLALPTGGRAGGARLAASPSGHFVQYGGRPLLLVGDNATQCMTQNRNMDYRRWLADCAARGIRSVHLWAFVAPRQRQDGSEVEARYGYVYPGLTPWARRAGGPPAEDGLAQWDLTRFDDSPGGYWQRLADLCADAKSKGIVVGITPFFGWPKHEADWHYHPFNVQNGGHLSDNGQVGIIANPGAEVWQEEWSDAWPAAKKTQWVWERFCLRLIRDCGLLGNVWFEFMDEHSYPEGNGGDHFRNFFRRRGMAWGDWDRRRAGVDLVYEQPAGTDKHAATVGWFEAKPARPFVMLESPPYQGDEFRTALWTCVMGGGHYHYQSDTGQETVTTGIMAYDPNVRGCDRAAYRTRLDWLGHCSRLFNETVADLDALRPHDELSSGAYVLANPGREYVLYSKQGSRAAFTLDLAAAPGRFACRFMNPRTGAFGKSFSRPGGGMQSFVKPDAGDWVLCVRADKEESGD